MSPKKSFLAVLVVAAGVLLSWAALSALPGLRTLLFSTSTPPVPAIISYQGILTDSSGAAITSSESMVFSIYPDSDAVSPGWSETQTVHVVDGLFVVYLGDITPVPDSIFDGSILYLGVKVGSDDEMTPRQRLGSVPYAFKSGAASCVESVWYADSDSDTYGSNMDSLMACEAPGGYVDVSGDCDDDASDVNPGAAESCNSTDNDCNGIPDDIPGDWCSTGLFGICSNGTKTCVAGATQCVQDEFPIEETCDGLDNDCDGSADEGNPGGGSACSTGQPGVCEVGTILCAGGSLICEPNVAAGPEVCDGLDNDCDAETDEGNPGGGGACATGQPGVCSTGVQQCLGGSLSCEPDLPATYEAVEVTCDGLDNDCDGDTDEGC